MRFLLILFVVVLIGASATAGGEKDKKELAKGEKKADKESYLLVVPPAGGKEVKLTDYRFANGTRPFSIGGDEIENPKAKGPEYLEFRELNSTTYKHGIFTLIPLTSVKKITYDREKKTVAVTALADGPEEVTLNGSTSFTTSNRITLEAESTLEGIEGKATVKFLGGTVTGMHSIAFPAPRPAEKVKGAAFTVTADDKEKSKHTAQDVQALYLVDGKYRVLPVMHFKKTLKVEMDKIASLKFVPAADKKGGSTDYEVTLKEGAKHTLSLLTTIEVEKHKITYIGLLGRVPLGYKLFSVDAIYEYRAGEEEKK